MIPVNSRMAFLICRHQFNLHSQKSALRWNYSYSFIIPIEIFSSMKGSQRLERSSFRKCLSSFFHLQNHIANLKIEITEPVVQIEANQIFNFPEVVELLVITSSEKGTLEFSLHYVKVAITQREDCPAHNLVETLIHPTKENKFK